MWQNRINRYEEIDFKKKLHFLYFVTVFLFLILLLRLFFLQIIKFQYFKYISENNRASIQKIRAPRGKIFDKNGVVLVDNRKVYNIVFTDLELDEKIIQNNLNELKNYLDFDETLVLEKIKSNKNKKLDSVIVARDIPEELMWVLKEKKPYLKGMDIVEDLIRDYGLEYESAHLFGYVSEITEKEFVNLKSEGYSSGDFLGKTGLEKEYEKYLKGIDGLNVFEIDVLGRKKRLLENVTAKKGTDIYLTIDYNLQKILEELIKDKLGTIIVLDAKDAKVLGMVSAPGFDANQFLYKINEEKFNSFNDNTYPMINRAIQCVYPPASTFKIITTIAALEQGVAFPNTKILCTGGMYIGKENRYVKCWKKQGGHGILDLMGAFMESCDVYYYNLALKLGVNNLFKYASGLGLNEKTGIDLPYEKKGTLPSIDWKKKKLRTNWYDGDTVNMGIGQGFMLTTPLQLADMLVNLINLGEIKTPHIVDNVVQNNVKFELSKGNPKPKIKLKKETTDFVFKSMFETVNSGTGKGTYIENLDVCGKTGTAQNPHGEDHAWFLGFAPYENPQVVVCVFIENGGGGGSIAAPIAKQVFLKCTELILKGKLKK